MCPRRSFLRASSAALEQHPALASLLMLVTLGCQHGRSDSGNPRESAVGPIPLTELAHVIAGWPEVSKVLLTDAGYVDTGEPVVPFTIVVDELAFPHDADFVECTWKPGDEMPSYRAVSRDPAASEAARTQAQMRDAGTSELDIEWSAAMEIGPDGTRPLSALRFDEQLRPTSVNPPQNSPDQAALRTYWVAFVCADRDRAAILATWATGRNDAKGWLMVLEKTGSTWHLLSARGKWQS
jgi:hypothetical protein